MMKFKKGDIVEISEETERIGFGYITLMTKNILPLKKGDLFIVLDKEIPDQIIEFAKFSGYIDLSYCQSALYNTEVIISSKDLILKCKGVI